MILGDLRGALGEFGQIARYVHRTCGDDDHQTELISFSSFGVRGISG